MRKMKLVIASAVVAVAGLVGMTVAQPAFAGGKCPEGSARGKDATYTNSVAECNVQPDAEGKGLMDTVKQIINVVLGLIGLVAVAVIILGGIQYTTSTGDAGKVKKAKDTILYGIIGLVVALLAFAIVNFVLTSVFSGSSSDSKPAETTTDAPKE